jgi:chromosome segregation ATPase
MSKDNGDFVAELLAKQQDLSKVVGAKKSELANLDNEQRKLTALVQMEKNSSQNAKGGKNKNHAPDKNTRGDIKKNEEKIKEQNTKITALRKELQHLETELRSVNHDLNIVNKAAS